MMKPAELQRRYADRKNEVLLSQDMISHLEASFLASSLHPELRWLRRDHLAFLRASQYLHLYNLIELTINGCLTVAEDAPKRLKSTHFDRLTDKLQSEIITQEVSKLTSSDAIVEAMIGLVSRIKSKEPARSFELRVPRNAGNWRQNSIQKVCERREIYPRFPPHIAQGLRIGSPIDNITSVRNDLAHGHKSFFDVGSQITSSDLADLVSFACDYLDTIVNSYIDYWEHHRYLRPA